MVMKKLLSLFTLERRPVKGLLSFEYALLGYIAITLVILLFLYTRIESPETMIWGRLRVVALTAALWAVYRLLPCRFTLLCRVLLQLAMLSWWYPETYEFNCVLPNLDHLFASWEQSLFGCQPSLLFSRHFSHPIVSELMCLGYVSYYPMIVAIAIYYYFMRPEKFVSAANIILTSFFLYYIIYILVPVAGPQYYYPAIGMDAVEAGHFTSVGTYFATHTEALATPGWQSGFFYDMVRAAHDAGERPTAAFPSSHVGVSTIVMLLAWRARNRSLILGLLPLYILLCLSTVYIYAHYAIDVLGGWISAVIFYFALIGIEKTKRAPCR